MSFYHKKFIYKICTYRLLQGITSYLKSSLKFPLNLYSKPKARFEIRCYSQDRSVYIYICYVPFQETVPSRARMGLIRVISRNVSIRQCIVLWTHTPIHLSTWSKANSGPGTVQVILYQTWRVQVILYHSWTIK